MCFKSAALDYEDKLKYNIKELESLYYKFFLVPLFVRLGVENVRGANDILRF